MTSTCLLLSLLYLINERDFDFEIDLRRVYGCNNSNFCPCETLVHPHRYCLTLDTPELVSCTCMQVPVCSRHRLQDRAQRLAGMWDTLVMGSIFSGHPMLTCRGRKQQSESLSILCIETKKAIN